MSKKNLKEAENASSLCKLDQFLYIQDKRKRANMKSKRKRNLFKKTCELEKLFDLDICIVIRDRETDKIYQFKSGSEEAGYFDVEVAHRAVEYQIAQARMKTSYNEVTNKAYEKVRTKRSNNPAQSSGSGSEDETNQHDLSPQEA